MGKQDKEREELKRREDKEAKKKKRDEEVDEELKQTFPASDPPSYSSPSHDEKDME